MTSASEFENVGTGPANQLERQKSEISGIDALTTSIALDQFNGHSLTTLTCNGRPLWIAVEVSTALGYPDKKSITIAIKSEWSDEFLEGTDYFVIRHEELDQLKSVMELYGKYPFNPKAGRLILLTEEGILKICNKTRKPSRDQFRCFVINEILPRILQDRSVDCHNVDEAKGLFCVPFLSRDSWNDHNQGCYAADTETLTENGWKLHHEIQPHERIAVYHPVLRQLQFEVPRQKHVTKVDEELIHFHGRNTDILVTADTKMLVCGSNAINYQVEPAKVTARRRFFNFVCAPAVPNEGAELKPVQLPNQCRRRAGHTCRDPRCLIIASQADRTGSALDGSTSQGATHLLRS